MESRRRLAEQHRYDMVGLNAQQMRCVGQPDGVESDEVEFIGTVMDITAQKHAEEALRNAQADLARVSRLTTMGELIASITHEINQPLAAVAANATACLRWLEREEPGAHCFGLRFGRRPQTCLRARIRRRCYERSVLKLTRTSSENSFGCSQAAKWPPLSSWL